MFADGDANLDGVVAAADVLLVLRILTGQYTPTPLQQQHMDVAPLVGGVPAPDGELNTGDLLLIQRKAMGVVGF